MTKKFTKGEDAQDYLSKHLELTDYICLGSTPEEAGGGFSLVMGEPATVISLMVMFFKNHPEILLQIQATIIKIFAGITPAQMAENEKELAKGCDCEGCGERKAKGGSAPEDETIH